MSEALVELLFDEFATRYLRGERPDVGDYLERAGGEREELGQMLDRFLEAVPAREPSEEEVVAMQARLERQPPLLLLRLRRALGREAVVEALVAKLGLDPAKRAKVGRYYAGREVGILDPEPVSPHVWEVLTDVLKANVRALAILRPEPPAPAVAYMREPTIVLRERAAMPMTAESVPPPEPDEVDKLFTASAA